MSDDTVTQLRDIADLVTRLRGACFNNSFDGTVVVATCSEGRWGLRCPPCATADLIEDQQDEIERLHEELDSFGTTRKALRDKIRLRTIQRDEARTEASMKGYRLDDALDEIERLRAAGDALVAVMRSGSDTGWDTAIDTWEARRG